MLGGRSDTVGECSSGAIALCSPLVLQAGPAILDVFTSKEGQAKNYHVSTICG